MNSVPFLCAAVLSPLSERRTVMPKPESLHRTDVRLTSTMAAVEASPRGEDTPLRVALLGDFSGRCNHPPPRTVSRLADRKPILGDRDNVDQVLSKLGVTLALLLAGRGA